MLKVILLRSKLTDKEKSLESLRAKKTEIKKRADDLEQAIGEFDDETTEEDKAEIEKQVNEVDSENTQLEKDIAELEAEIAEMNSEISKLEEEEERTRAAAKQTRSAAENNVKEHREMKRSDIMTREDIMTRSEVKDWLQNVRDFIGNKRAVTNAELTIPEVMLPLFREEVSKRSKLYRYVNAKHVTGKARQTIMGVIPEALWLEMYTDKEIQELALNFDKAEVDGYMVAGLVTVPNAIIEDSDLNLRNELFTAIAGSIAKALDRAIIYGKGSASKQPEGVMKNLKADNIIAVTHKGGLDVFKQILMAKKKVKTYEITGGYVWCMNESTKTTLQAEALGFNTNGAIVTGINNTMPVLGGDIVTLDFMPDDVIIGGIGQAYLLAERQGTTLDSSDQAKFTSHQTIFKGIARYDGKLLKNDTFIALGLNNKKPTADGTPAA